MPRNRIAATLAIAFCSLAAVIGSGSGAHAATTAPAYAPASNERLQYLTSSPTTSDPTASVSRSIYLAAGCYERDLYIETSNWEDIGDITKGAIYLSAGWYQWQDALIPEPNYSYTLQDLLVGSNPYTNPSIWTFPSLHVPYNGNYHWGTGLRWLSTKCPPY